MDFKTIIYDLKSNYGIKRPLVTLNSLESALNYFERIGTTLLEWQNRTFELSDNNLLAIKKLIDWSYMRKDYRLEYFKGILLKGQTGVGKTLLIQILNEFWKIDGLKFISNGVTYPLKAEIVSAYEIAGAYEVDGFSEIKRYSQIPLLCIDDLGAENVSSNFGNKHSAIAEVIFRRNAENKLTFATTNLDKLSDVYDDRTVSRMCEMFNVIAFLDSSDFRKE